MALRSLKHLIREKPTASEYAALLEKVKGYPDRAATIILSTHVEDNLEQLVAVQLRHGINKTDRSTILEGEGFLSRFSAKILFASAFGFIGPETRRDLTRLKDVRNAFAHARTDISFTTPEVAEHCAMFEAPGKPRFHPISEADLKRQPAMQAVKDWQEAYQPPTAARERFILTAAFLNSRLSSATLHVMEHTERMRPSEHVP